MSICMLEMGNLGFLTIFIGVWQLPVLSVIGFLHGTIPLPSDLSLEWVAS